MSLSGVARLVGFLFLTACASRASDPPPPGPAPAAIWGEIESLEDARVTGDGRLQALLADRSFDPATRARAATALGRIAFPEGGSESTRALLEALSDADATVRAAAAFALGMRGDPSAADKLLFVALDEHQADPDALVRARAIEAATKLARPELRERTLEALRDRDPRVRLEAAEGAQRWPASEPSAAAVDRALVEHLASEPDVGVRTYALASLERRKAELARPLFLRFAAEGREYERLFAVRGLARIEPCDDALDALRRASLDPDWRVASEALLGLGQYPLAQVAQTMKRALDVENVHVRRCAFEGATASYSRTSASELRSPNDAPVGLEELGATHLAAELEPSAGVRAAAITARLVGRAGLPSFRGTDNGSVDKRAERDARLVRELVESYLRSSGATTDPYLRAAIARAVGRLPSQVAVPRLIEFARESDVRVAGAAIEALGAHPSAESRATLHRFLGHPDNGLRLAAVTALAEMPDASDLPELARAFAASAGDISTEVRFNALRNAGKIGGNPAHELLLSALSAPEPFVRTIAREELAKGWPGEVLPEPAALPLERSRAPATARDRAGSANPWVEVETTRGTLLFELFPAEAPTHVASFLALAARDHYDGLYFHRVVPDFVVQGGDYRGDGNGGTTSRVAFDARKAFEAGARVPSDSLRHEIGPRKFVRGSLGMPRNDDWDSGGSQIFVTHRPTPHLDGRYTIFGELRAGFGALDALEVGDKILDVRLARARPPR